MYGKGTVIWFFGNCKMRESLSRKNRRKKRKEKKKQFLRNG